jgi:hypothetical protein
LSFYFGLLFQNASSADTLSSRGKTEDYETKVVSKLVKKCGRIINQFKGASIICWANSGEVTHRVHAFIPLYREFLE